MALAGCAGAPQAVGESDPLYGTWLNIYYVPAAWPQLIHHPDGEVEIFREIGAELSFYSGTFTIEKKWTDRRGDIWYWVEWDLSEGTRHNLMRMSHSGTVLEVLWDFESYPEELDRSSPDYRLYRRKP
jgi:hypothetical protein